MSANGQGVAGVDLSVDLAPGNPRRLRLANPVMTASGTFGYGVEYAKLFDVQALGAIVCKGTTLKARDGNPQPRTFETASGMLNSIGLQNAGVDVVIDQKAPVWAGWRVPVIVNIAGETIDEYASIARRLDTTPGVSGIEVNISCPNVKEGGAEFGVNPDSAARVTMAVRSATSLPILVKLTPNTGRIVDIAKAVSDAGADAITLINTLKGMAIDIRSRRPYLGNVSGGLSGPAIKPVALHMVYQVTAATTIPVIGCGGISVWQDAIEFILAGASAVQVGTANFSDPMSCLSILSGIENYCDREGLRTLSQIVGAAHRH